MTDRNPNNEIEINLENHSYETKFESAIDNRKNRINHLIKSPIFVFTSILFLLIGIFSAVYLTVYQKTNLKSEANLAPNWVYPDFACRNQITIINQAHRPPHNAAQQPYTAKVILDQAFFQQLNNNCQVLANGSDIRFATAQGEKLPYFKRKWIYKEEGIFNVRLPYLDPEKNEIYVYFNNPSAKTSSNPHQAFDYYQDFSSFNPTIKFGIFTDIHHDSEENHYWDAPDGEPAALRDARDRMRIITSAMNNWGADFVISLGDLITGEDFTPENVPAYPASPTAMTGELSNTESSFDLFAKSKKSMQEIEAAYREFKGPRYYVHSNHDFYYLSEEELMVGKDSLLGGQGAIGNQKTQLSNGEQSYFSFDQGGVRFILLDLQYEPDTNKHRGPEGASNYGEGYMPQFQLDWLENQLSSSQGPVVIFSPSHLEPSDYYEDEYPEEIGLCEQAIENNYCTDSDCQTHPEACIQKCQNLGQYRRVKNAKQIRSVLEQHNDKILVVFQGNDHAKANYFLNGIHYRTLDGAETLDPKQVSYYKVEIDPTQRLIAIEGLGENNTYKVAYEDGKMIIDSQLKNQFLPPIIHFGQTWDNDILIEGSWELKNGRQVAFGFWRNADYLTLHHRCATKGRQREINLAGIKRVYSQQDANNYIGTEINKKFDKNNQLFVENDSSKGYFWALHNDNQARFFYTTPKGSGASKALETNIPNMGPGVWVWNNSRAEIDQLIVRKTVYPEPISQIGDLEIQAALVSANEQQSTVQPSTSPTTEPTEYPQNPDVGVTQPTQVPQITKPAEIVDNDSEEPSLPSQDLTITNDTDRTLELTPTRKVKVKILEIDGQKVQNIQETEETKQKIEIYPSERSKIIDWLLNLF